MHNIAWWPTCALPGCRRQACSRSTRGSACADDGMQPHDLLAKLPNHLCVRIFVDNGLADDLLGAIGVTQSAECFVIIDVGRTDQKVDGM